MGQLRRARAEVLEGLLRGDGARRTCSPTSSRRPDPRATPPSPRSSASKTKAEWAAFNDEHDCCIEPVLDLDEALDSDLVREREMVVEMEQPELGPVRLLGMPVKFSAAPGDATRPAPALGEHTEEVLRAAGIDGDELTALLDSGAAAGVNADAEQQKFLG